MAGTLQLGYKGKGKVHLYKPQSCICHYSGAVHHRQAGVQCRLRLKPTLTDFGTRPYSRMKPLSFFLMVCTTQLQNPQRWKANWTRWQKHNWCVPML